MNASRRATAIRDAAAGRLERIIGGVPVPTRAGTPVVIRRVEQSTVNGVTCLEVWVDTNQGEPHYRFINPPLLVRDPAGPVERNGRRYREDPLAALAEVIARHRGTVVKARR